MFCGNCGTSNQDGAAFCANCGAPLVSNAQPVNAQPEYAQPAFAPEYAQPGYAPEYAPEYTPAAPKKNLKPIIIGVAVAAVAIILLIVLLGGGNGYGSAEDAALAAVEGAATLDIDKATSAMHPDMYDDDDVKELEESLEDAEEMYDSMGISVDDFEVSKVKDIDEDEYDDYEDEIKDEFDIDVEITDMKKVTVSYLIEYNGGEQKNSQTVTVMEIDGDWYVYGD